MDKLEFSDLLRRSLSGRLDAAAVDEHVQYYNDYIDIRIKKGSSEEEVLAQLGDPRLIAKSILNASNAANPDTTSDQTVQDASGKIRQGQTSGHIFGGITLRAVILGVLLALVLATLILLAVVAQVLYLLIPLLGVVLIAKAVMTLIKALREK